MNSRNARKVCNSTERPAARRPEARLGELLLGGRRRLRAAGVDSPDLCAELLLAHALGCDRAALLRRSGEATSRAETARFEELLSRRARREPVQQILGWTEFWSLRVRCDARGLIPRPETELLVEMGLELWRREDAPLLADLGTGSGCIALALAHELPAAQLYASDLSAEALALAAENFRAHGISRRVRLLEGDLAAPFLAAGLEGKFDGILCNPPYVPDGEIPGLDPEVRDHDPRRALSGGPDGLRVIARLLAEAPPLLKPGGFLLIEIGEGQAAEVRALARASGRLRALRSAADAAGTERALLLQREIR